MKHPSLVGFHDLYVSDLTGCRAIQRQCDALLDDSCHFGKFQCQEPLPLGLDLSAVINAHKLD
ncbi:hypothetical protein IKI14_04430 [bacterium]|nr:hypothetical protein [bacterium]